jgi:C1A family cysteine protease
MARPRKSTRRRTARPRRQKRILNCRPSPKTEDDWTFDDAASAEVTAAAPAIPTSKDLRASWWTINDQGSTGSCVGWASADSLLRWHFVKAGKLTTSQLLSPRFMWMASKETDPFVTRPTTFIETEGTSLKTALDVARKFGVVRDTTLPFASGKLYAGQAKTFYAIAALRKIMVRLDVDSTWDDATFSDGKLDTYNPSSTRGGHAVALVGYTADRFIVRNSWGTGWGDKGFGYASPAYAQAAFTEAYGVEV